MVLHVLNIVRRFGVGKTSGRPYDFTNVQYLEPVETISTENFNQDGIGYETAEIPATPEVLKMLRKFDFPLEVEFTTDHRKGVRGLEVVLVGIVEK